MQAEDFLRLYISIHAPRAGSDYTGWGLRHRPVDFNPRSPCGERRGQRRKGAGHEKFQSTLPVRGATKICSFTAINLIISIHAPRAGSDGRRNGAAHNRGDISIHAPRAGSDPFMC